MQPESAETILERVKAYCISVINLENRPTDDEIYTCERILDIINQKPIEK